MAQEVKTVASTQKTPSFGRVEAIPLAHRRMSNWDLFATWIGANANGTWYIGGHRACGFVTASTTLRLSA